MFGDGLKAGFIFTAKVEDDTSVPVRRIGILLKTLLIYTTVPRLIKAIVMV